MTEVLITLVLLLVVGFVIAGINAAYRNGVRDGYANSWLPRVKSQVEREGLRQYKNEHTNN